MREQKFCANCGLLNWSQWGALCNCKEPDFRFDKHADYLSYCRNKPVEMQTIKVNEWTYDMSINERGNIEGNFSHEGKNFVFELTERDVTSLKHLFTLARISDQIK